MSLYELLSTASALTKLNNKSSAKPTVSDEEWEQSLGLITHLANFDPSIKI